MSDTWLTFLELNDNSLLLSYSRGGYRYSTQGMSKYMCRPFVTYSLKCLSYKKVLLEPSHHVMSPVQAYLDSYGPVVNDSTSSWTQKCILGVDGPK
jgi:hypothetical protein